MTASFGDGGASPPHASTTTPGQARAIVEPTIEVVQALADLTADQARRYGRLLHTLAAAGSGTLGRPGAVEEIERQLADLDALAPRVAGLQGGLAERTPGIRAAVTGQPAEG